MLPKPSSCSGCVLESIGAGYAPADGPDTASVLFVGESLGFTEAQIGRPMVGDAGGMLSKLFTLGGWDRTRVRIDNTIRCRPPQDDLSRFPAAIDHCAQHLNDSLASPYLKVVVPMGGAALKRVMQIAGKKIGPENFHGTATRDPFDRFWVVPTYHPSFLQRGAHNLIGTVLWDLQQAKEIALHGKAPDQGSLVIDPPVEWFTLWVDTVLQAAQQDPSAYPVSVDVETPDKAHGQDEGEITAEDRSYQILRVNVSCHPEEGITVPFVGPYLDQLQRLLGGPQPLFFWNKAYDVPRLVAAGSLSVDAELRSLDLMWLWHYLQSDLPRGLGFVAPFYSSYGPWKHLADSDPAKYGAIDGLQTHRVGFGISADLHRLGMYAGALRHVHALHHLALQPAQQVGVRIDRSRLLLFKADLTAKATRTLDKIQTLIPDALKPLSPKGGLTKRPADNVLHVKATAFTRKGTERKGKPASEVKLDLYKGARVVEREIVREVLCCGACGATEVHRKHRCADRTLVPTPVLTNCSLTRYFWQEPFNPDSWQQVLAYIKHQHHLPGKAKKTRKDSTDRETLERLTKTGDPFYALLLDFRAVQKVKGTYVDGTERRLDDEDRIHPEPTFKPSTMRLSYVNPNITNVVSRDRPGQEPLAAGFRRCVVPSHGSRLAEFDFSGSEAVDVGWLSRDPTYIRLAKLGVHAGLASHILGTPYDPTASDAELGAFFQSIKNSKDPKVEAIYNRSKRYVHGSSYGLTIPGMTLQFPETFPTRKIAEEYAEIFRQMAPSIPAWQQQTREIAARQHYLGGPGAHPFGYKHWFWSVYTFKKITSGQYWAILNKFKRAGKAESECPVSVINGQYFKIGLGEDGKRCIAFMPQSITAAKLKEVMLRLFDPESPCFIGDAYYGKTPLRAPIHDSLLLEIPTRTFDLVASIVINEMQRPVPEMPCPLEWGFGPALSTGVSAKTSLDSWASMEKLPVAGFTELGVGSDSVVTAALAEEQEEVDDLGRSVA